MALRRPDDRNRTVVRVAIVSAVVMVGAAAIVFTLALTKGPRPEQDVALAFIEQVLAGDGEDAYARTTPGYRTVVFPPDLDALSTLLAEMVGDGVAVTILGSERAIRCEPLTSLVGYTATTAIGDLRGVVTMIHLEEQWLVRDISYRFTEASAAQLAPLDQLSRELNAQLASRLEQRQSADSVLAEDRCLGS